MEVVAAAGGRVLCATALGKISNKLKRMPMLLAKSIHWYGCFYRHDIGYRAIARLKSKLKQQRGVITNSLLLVPIYKNRVLQPLTTGYLRGIQPSNISGTS